MIEIKHSLDAEFEEFSWNMISASSLPIDGCSLVTPTHFGHGMARVGNLENGGSSGLDGSDLVRDVQNRRGYREEEEEGD